MEKNTELYKMFPRIGGGDRVGATIVNVFGIRERLHWCGTRQLGAGPLKPQLSASIYRCGETAEFTHLVIPTVDAPGSLRESKLPACSDEPDQITRNSIRVNNARMHIPQSDPDILFCPACGRSMRLASTSPRFAGWSELRSYECRSCSVYFTTAQPSNSRDAGVLVRPA
jgi:hypothetical protein